MQVGVVVECMLVLLIGAVLQELKRLFRLPLFNEQELRPDVGDAVDQATSSVTPP